MAEYSIILCKISFSALASTMLYYWIRLSFAPSFDFLKPKLLPPFVMHTCKAKLDRQQERSVDRGFFEKTDIGFFGILVSNLSLTLLLMSRWFESRHFPFSNLFESLLLLCWTLTAIHLALAFIESLKGFYSLLGVLLSPLALFTNAFATFCLPEELQQSTVLVPALQSNWLAMHVSVMILSYGFLLSGSLLALAYLLFKIFFSLESSPKPNIFNFGGFSFSPFLEESQPAYQGSFSTQTFSKERDNTKQNQATNPGTILLNFNTFILRLDNGSYRCIGLGFAFLTLGILSGAVWANEAWGSYWSWDPKETWALVTWIIYALYLHLRLNKGWKGEKPAYVAIFGFLSVWLCYLGVNLLGVGLHSYGWLS